MLTNKQKSYIAWYIYDVYAKYDPAVELCDVRLWVDYYSLQEMSFGYVKNNVMNKIMSKGESNIIARKNHQDWFLKYDELRSYFLEIIGETDDDIINKLWYEELGILYEKEYDVNLVELIFNGYKQREIAEMLGVDDSVVVTMLKGIKNKHKLGIDVKMSHSDRKIIELVGSFSVATIAKMVGVSRQTVYNCIRRNNGCKSSSAATTLRASGVSDGQCVEYSEPDV